MTMNYGDALLKAVLAEPDEDVHRLAYADWLQDNGDPDRGEFIAIQCERDRRVRSGVRMDDHERAMRDREAELWRRHSSTPGWFGEFCLWPLPPAVIVRRGFLDELEVQGGWFMCKEMEELPARHPLRVVTVTIRWGEHAQRISSTIPPWLRVLRFCGCLAMTGAEAVAVLSHSKHAGWENTLEELAFENGNLAARDVLLAGLPRVRIRAEGALYSPQNERGNRTILEKPIRATAGRTEDR